MADNKRSIQTIRVVAAVLAVGAAAVLAGCTPISGANEPRSPAATAGFGHVHGLGADPSTGETYAATHNGVWRIPTGALPDTYSTGAGRNNVAEPRQIAGRAQDTMGFTVGGPGLLLASGHPDPADRPALNPPNLGLISSTDGAETWTSISLQGQTDFHDLDSVALDNGELRVYGYDAGAGTVTVSDDSGVTWSPGAQVELRDLAADPSRPDRVFGTSADGILVSEDSGETFAGVAGAPVLLLIVAMGEQAGGGFIGIDPEGAVWRQDAEAGTWTKTGQTDGAPEALGYVGGTEPWILAADRRGIVASGDYGASWTILVQAER